MILLGFALGALLGLAAVPAIARLPRGIPERLAQPAWTARAGSPLLLVVAGALVGAALGAAAPDRTAFALTLLLLAVLLPATAIDVAWRVVPDTLIVVGTLGGVAILVLADREALVPHLAAGLIGGTCAFAVALVARGGFGLGDVKVIAMTGVVLGAALPLAVVGGLVLAGIAAMPLLVVRGRGATLPLVPFLAAGALLACLVPLHAVIAL